MKYLMAKGPIVIKAMVQTHNVIGSPIIDLYVKFVNIDEGDRTSTTVPVLAGTE